MKKRVTAKLVVSLLAVVSVILLTLLMVKSKRGGTENMEELNIFVPFVFSNKFDPRAVHSVGDQMVAEHVFAFHNSTSLKNSIIPLFSDVKIDRILNTIEVNSRKDIINSNGEKFSLKKIFEAIKSSFSGTQHTKYSHLVRSMTYDNEKIFIQMDAVPVNLEQWLRSSDFAIFDLNLIPINSKNLFPSTGPYRVVSMKPNEVKLQRNRYFPQEFIANKIDRVNFKTYSSGDTSRFILENIGKFDLAYFYGYGITHEHIKKLEASEYKVQIFPNEWLVLLCFQRAVPINDRKIIASKIDSWRKELEQDIVMGTPSYSIVPSDRPFGLSKNEYEETRNDVNSGIFSKRLTIATLSEWSSIPLFSKILENLKKEFNVKVKLFDRSEMIRVYSKEEADLYLSPMGVSMADPLGNLSFFLSYDEVFKEVLTENKLSALYQKTDLLQFSEEVKKIEKDLLKNRSIIPIGHFPGVVAESLKIKRDELKSWNWGIQAWSYKID